ncbi:MAG: nucleotidyltransferase domain-containing protein [Blastocatellia bacterium]
MNQQVALTQHPPSPSFDAAPRRQQIDRVCAAIADEFQPERIILFGSYAYGTPDADSDVDVLVIMPFAGSPFRQAGEILSRIVQRAGALPLDLLVRTAEQVQERLAIGDHFIREIIERGKVVYEKDHD